MNEREIKLQIVRCLLENGCSHDFVVQRATSVSEWILGIREAESPKHIDETEKANIP